MNHMCRAFKTSQQLDISTTALLRMSLQCLKRNYCASKEISVPHLSQGQDILLHDMRSATNVSEVLSSVRLHYQIMNNIHLMQAFRSIFVLQKSNNSLLTNCEVINSPGFRVLCLTLKSKIRTLDPGEVLDALKALSFLGVPSTSKLGQILLHILTKEMNSLSLQQLLFLDFLLKDFTTSPIVEALKIALPLVVENNLKLKVDRGNISQLCDLLYYAAKRDFSQTSVNFLIEGIMRHRSLGSIDPRSCSSIVRALCNVENSQELHGSLLRLAIDGLVDNPSNQTYFELGSLISKLGARYSKKNYYFYHEKLLNTTTNSVINRSCNFEETVWHLRRLMKFGYVSIELLDYIWKMVEKEPELLRKCQTVFLFTLVGGFAQADYSPVGWKLMEPLIIENAVSYLDKVELPWVKFARDLGTLNCWHRDILCRLFSSEFLEKYLSRDFNAIDRLQLLSLHSAFASLCEWYEGPLIPNEIFNSAGCVNTRPTHEYRLMKYVSNIFGSEDYIITGISSKQGHFIDYLVVLGENGSPVSLSHFNHSLTRIFIEDIPLSNRSQKLALLYLPVSSFITNTGQFRGPTRMMIDALECTGTTVIPISSMVWDQLLESEKILHIQQEIFKKVPLWNVKDFYSFK